MAVCGQVMGVGGEGSGCRQPRVECGGIWCVGGWGDKLCGSGCLAGIAWIGGIDGCAGAVAGVEPD